MFTGLVEAIGTLRIIERRNGGLTLRVELPPPASTSSSPDWNDLQLGESVAVDGVCLTVVEVRSNGFVADASAETLQRSTLGHAVDGQPLHLERALRVGDRLGGHLVSGHVDGIGQVVSTTPLGDALQVRYAAPATLAPCIATKGSIVIDGVSLTVNHVDGAEFEVALVPYTRQATHLDRRRPGDRVNLEIDLLARYVARALQFHAIPPQG